MAPLGAMSPSAPAILLALLIATSGLSSVLGDHGSHFTVHEYHQSPTCNEPVQEGFGLSSRIYRNDYCYQLPGGGLTSYSYKLNSTHGCSYSGNACDSLQLLGCEATSDGACRKESPDDPDNKYYIKHVSTNLAGMQYDMKEDFVVNRCQVPGSVTPRNDYYDPRDYGKCYEHDNYQTYDLLIAQQAPIIIVSSYGESQSCPSDGGPALNYTALYIPFETCTFVGGMQDPEAYIAGTGRSGALEFFASLYDTPKVDLPFKEDNTPDPSFPVPHVGDRREWVHNKAYEDKWCQGSGMTRDFEAIWEMGRCYRMPGAVNVSHTVSRDQFGRASYALFYMTEHCDNVPMYKLPLENDLGLGCANMWEGHAVSHLEAQSYNTSSKGFAVVLLTFFDDKCSTDDEGSHTEYQINMYPEGGCLNDPDSTESTLYERVGPNTVRKTFFHQHDCKEETFNFKIDFDFGTCVESFGQGAGFAQMALDPETAAFDLLNVFPGSVASDFPLVSSQPSQPVQRTWTSYQWYMDASCSQPAPASPIFLKENELCYDAESSGPSSSNYGSGRFTTSEQYGGMEVWQMFTGQACKPENLYNTVSIGDGACVKVPEPTSPYYIKFEDTTIANQSFTTSKDVVVSHGCKFDYSEISFLARNYFECSPWDGNTMWFPMLSDGQHHIIEKK